MGSKMYTCLNKTLVFTSNDRQFTNQRYRGNLPI